MKDIKFYRTQPFKLIGDNPGSGVLSYGGSGSGPHVGGTYGTLVDGDRNHIMVGCPHCDVLIYLKGEVNVGFTDMCICGGSYRIDKIH